ncbi:2-hydroxyacid dehydrogenase [Thermodesulfobacteriota bacterium]
MKVFITQLLEQEAIDILSEVAEVKTSGVGRPLTRKEFLDGIKDADAVIHVWHTEIMDEAAMDSAPNLKVISRRGVGYDNIDIDAATRRGIFVTYTPVHIATISDLTFGLIINAARRLHRADAFVRSGAWTEGGSWVAKKFMGYDVNHKNLGIIGLGRIGYEVAKRGKGFDMKVKYYDVVKKSDAEKELNIEYSDLEELIKTSDFIAVTCAKTEKTKNLMNAERISMMKEGAILVVSARGGIVDEKALYKALKSGKLGGAGLDVFEPEPIDKNDPLLKLDNVMFTPHLGTTVLGTRINMAVSLAEDIVSIFKGQEPKYSFNKDVLKKR